MIGAERVWRRGPAVVAAAGMLMLWTTGGCGGKGSAQPVTGTVTFDGKPVSGGTLTFSPVVSSRQMEAGPPATAEIQSDGTFTLTTRKKGDGAVAGKYRVSYSSPAAEAPEETGDGPTDYSKLPPPSPYDGLVPRNKEVEVTKGKNDIAIELVKPPKQPTGSNSNS